MWTECGLISLFILICGVVECKSCPKKKWLCYASSEDCNVSSDTTTGQNGNAGQLK